MVSYLLFDRFNSVKSILHEAKIIFAAVSVNKVFTRVRQTRPTIDFMLFYIELSIDWLIFTSSRMKEVSSFSRLKGRTRGGILSFSV